MRFPTPNVSPQVGQSPQFSAPRTVPMQDYTGEQLDQFGRNLAKAGEATSAVAEHFQDLNDDARVKEADALTMSAFRKTLRGEGGYLYSAGKSALEGRDATIRALEQARSQAEKVLTNDVQRQVFATYSQRRMEAALADVDGHFAREQTSYAMGESKARLDASVLDSVDHIDPPAGQGPGKVAPWAEVNAGVAVKEANEYADLAGWGADDQRRKNLVLDTTTRIHAGRVQKLVAQGRVDQAKSYFDGIKPAEVDSETATKLGDLVRRASVNDESTKLAMDIIGGLDWEKTNQSIDLRKAVAGEPIEPKQVLVELLTVARAKADQQFKDGKISAEVHRATVDLLKEEYNLRVNTENASAVDAMRKAEAWLTQNPLKGVTAMPPELYNSLARVGKLGEINGFADGRRYTTDPAAVSEVLSLPADALRGLTANEVFLRYRGKLNDQDLRVVQAMHAQANAVAKPEDIDILGVHTRIKEAAMEQHIIPRTGRPEDDQSRRFYLFRQDIQNRLTAKTQRLGRKLTTDEVQQTIDESALDQAKVKATTLGVDWLSSDPNMPVGVMTKAEQEAASVSIDNEDVMLTAVPDDERAKIIETLNRRGLPVSERAIVALWVAGGRRGAPVQNITEQMRANPGITLPPVRGAALGQPKPVLGPDGKPINIQMAPSPYDK